MQSAAGPGRAPLAQPPARVPSLAGGPRAVPSVLLRPPAHLREPAQRGRGPRWGRLPGSGEAAGGAWNARARAQSLPRRVAESGARARAGAGPLARGGAGRGLWLSATGREGPDSLGLCRAWGRGLPKNQTKSDFQAQSLRSGVLSCFSAGAKGSDRPGRAPPLRRG